MREELQTTTQDTTSLCGPRPLLSVQPPGQNRAKGSEGKRITVRDLAACSQRENTSPSARVARDLSQGFGGEVTTSFFDYFHL